jgi:hypothetical protein
LCNIFHPEFYANDQQVFKIEKGAARFVCLFFCALILSFYFILVFPFFPLLQLLLSNNGQPTKKKQERQTMKNCIDAMSMYVHFDKRSTVVVIRIHLVSSCGI